MNIKISPSLLRAAVVFCALLAAPLNAAEKWLRLSSEHFDMMSSSSEKDSRRALIEMERFRTVFFMWFAEGKKYYPRPLVFVFNNPKEFAALNKMSDGSQKHRGGFFMPGIFGPRIALPRKSPAQGLATVFHECAHSLVSASQLGLPLWLNEGVAEVYESFSTYGPEITLGKTHTRHLRILLARNLIPLETFFNTNHFSPHYNDKDKLPLFYAQSWIITHYIMMRGPDNKNPAQNLKKYIELYKKTRKPTEAELSEVFGMSFAELEQTLRKYIISGISREYKVRLPADLYKNTITCRTATAQEVECELAILKLRATRATDPRKEKTLAQIAKKYPDSPRAWELRVEMETGVKRVEYAQKAIQFGSRNPLLHIWLLREQIRKARWSPDTQLPPEESEKLRRDAARILAIEPDCMEAHAMVATIESLSEKMSASNIQRSNEALAQMNDREYHETLLALALISWRRNDHDQAKQMMQRLLDEDGVSRLNTQRAKTLQTRIERTH